MLGCPHGTIVDRKGSRVGPWRPVKTMRMSLGDETDPPQSFPNRAKNYWFSLLFQAMGVSWALSRRSLRVLGRSLGSNIIFDYELKWIRHPMLVLEGFQASSEQLWEPEGTPRSDGGAYRLNPKVSVG